MTNDSHLFWTSDRLKADKAYPVAGSRWQKGKRQFVPLYVGRMIHQFDHRAASVGTNPDNIHVAAHSEWTSAEEHAEPDFVPAPQFWVDEASIRWHSDHNWTVGFRDIARTTDERTVISSIVPKAAFGNKLPLMFSDDLNAPAYLVGNLNSFVLDFVARRKIQSVSLNWYIAEQLPIVSDYTRKFGKRKASDIVRDQVLRLSYTANDLADFARDMGHIDPKTGNVLPPFKWDEEERVHLRARLDALYFLLYGVTDRDDVRYILSTFPGVREDDEKKHGRYRTQELILAYMSALEAGDTETKVAL
jgi:hypothetical protein